MLIAALRDMQWRKRRFVIAILSTSIIFAMTLALTGLANGFRVEADKTVDSLGVDLFLVKAGASGPFVGAIPLTIGGAWVNRPMAVPQRSVLVELVEPYSSANQTSHGLAGSRCAPE